MNKERLPVMWNVIGISSLMMVLSIAALALQVHPNVDYGEAEWIFVGGVLTTFGTIVTTVTNYYVGGNGGPKEEEK